MCMHTPIHISTFSAGYMLLIGFLLHRDPLSYIRDTKMAPEER
jgi:hypothetical protein